MIMKPEFRHWTLPRTRAIESREFWPRVAEIGCGCGYGYGCLASCRKWVDPALDVLWTLRPRAQYVANYAASRLGWRAEKRSQLAARISKKPKEPLANDLCTDRSVGTSWYKWQLFLIPDSVGTHKASNEVDNAIDRIAAGPGFGPGQWPITGER